MAEFACLHLLCCVLLAFPLGDPNVARMQTEADVRGWEGWGCSSFTLYHKLKYFLLLYLADLSIPGLQIIISCNSNQLRSLKCDVLAVDSRPGTVQAFTTVLCYCLIKFIVQMYSS